MAVRLNVRFKVADAREAATRTKFQSLVKRGTVKEVARVDSYLIDAPLSSSAVARIKEVLFTPQTQTCSVGIPRPPRSLAYAIEVGYLPGVTDNVGKTAKEALESVLKRRLKAGEEVYALKTFFLSGVLTKKDAQRIAAAEHNPLIERASVLSGAEYASKAASEAPRVELTEGLASLEVNLFVPDEELLRISKEGIAGPQGRRGPLALPLEALKTIRTHFHRLGRNPTDVELESLAQTWSEHCKHGIFSDPLDEITEGIYRTYIKGATKKIREEKGKDDFCVSVFTDNSGAIAFDDEYLVTHKVETHNSPSALDPFGGAITGIVGVNRDTIGFGIGAKPVINVYGFCVGNPDSKQKLFRNREGTSEVLSPSRILEGVVRGVGSGGNESGIPSPQGFVCVDDRYSGKPLVFAGTVGLIPRMIRGRDSTKKKARPGDLIVVVGNRVGLDGIHGATFSSVALDSRSPVTAVQIGDPITQKKMSDALIKEARDKGLYSSITDNGAGGLSCSVAEMAKEMRLPAGRQGGCVVSLEKAPLKYAGLLPWQIWISESQERMTLAVPPSKWNALRDLLKRHGVEAAAIGTFTDSGRAVVRFGGKVVMDMEMEFLHDGRPVQFQKSESPTIAVAPAPAPSKNLSRSLTRLLSDPSIGSFSFISSQYDHEVQGGSVTKPLQGRGRVNAEATVTRPLLSSQKAVVLSQGYAPWYAELDSYRMATAAIDSAIRSAIAAGADPDHLALLDNFCWCSSGSPERLFQLKEAARACHDAAIAYGAPFISGKDSMFNDFKGFDSKGNPIAISVPPTLLISAISVVKDAGKAVTLDFKMPGDLLYVLGETKDEMGGSAYYSKESGLSHVLHRGAVVPSVAAAKNKELYRRFFRAVKGGLVASALSIGRGGLAVALGKASLGGMLGLEADVASLAKLPADKILFGESQGRILASVAPKQKKAFEKIMGDHAALIGTVTNGSRLIVRQGKKEILKLALSQIAEAYRKPFSAFV